MNAPNALRRSRRTPAPGRGASAGGTLIGIFIGVVVGLGLAAGVAYWLMKNNPALSPSRSSGGTDAPTAGSSTAATPAPGKPRFDFYKILPGVEEAKPQPDTGRAAAGSGPTGATAPGPARMTAVAPQPTLPQQAAPQQAMPQQAMSQVGAAAGGAAVAPKAGTRSWLQAGSFSTDADAENLKARLALAGLEASVQSGALADGSVRYRVRLGPYDNADELARMKSELAKRGFDVAVVR